MDTRSTNKATLLFNSEWSWGIPGGGSLIMFSNRTKLSLAQFLRLQDVESVGVLLSKYDIAGLWGRYAVWPLQELARALLGADNERIASMISEVIQTQSDLRSHVDSPKRRFEERFADLRSCLLLDGYVIDDNQLVPIDPSISEGPVIEDDLIRELNASGLSEESAVIRKLEASAEAFRGQSPNFNACLNDARIALATLAANIAQYRLKSYPGSFDHKKWGSVISYLRSTDFIVEEEEKGLVGVYKFVSPGSHRPIGLSDEEYARLGRSFVAGMCWFLVKRYRASEEL